MDPVGVILFAAAVLALIVALAAAFVFLRRPARPAPAALDLRIDVAKLAPTVPPVAGPRLEIRHVPVRLALLVLAPVGRGKPLGDPAARADAIVPGLAECLAAHGTRLLCWPPQLSSQGFVQSFFGNAPLPGNRGIGTIWTAVAGKCDDANGSFLAAMLLSAERPNALGQITVNGAHEWLELLRVEARS